jgi:hypothetical protein
MPVFGYTYEPLNTKPKDLKAILDPAKKNLEAQISKIENGKYENKKEIIAFLKKDIILLNLKLNPEI